MANKAIFLDRDDTLIEDPGYINDPDQVELLDNVHETLGVLKAMGYKLVVVSNQSGVARGIVTEEALGLIHKRLEQLLAEKGVVLDGIYYCPYHPDGAIPKYRRDSDLRKPNPGMLLTAGRDLEIDLKESWMVGNSPGDIEAGARAGCKTILVDSKGHEQKIQPGERAPDYRAINLKEVVNIIKMHSRSQQRAPVTPAPAVEPGLPPVAEPQNTPAQAQQPLPVSQPGAAQTGEDKQTTQQLLTDILDQLKAMRRTSMFGEFYVSRFVAGFVQVLVFVCLLVCVYFLLSFTGGKYNAVMISLGFAVLFQIMALTFYIMQGPK
jgi:D,D-heptose 1,7-bisphosphate phosphatase